METRTKYLCEDLNGLRGLDTEQPATANPTSLSLVDELCDILSSFDDRLLPEEFRESCEDPAPPATNFDKLSQTLFRMGMIEVEVFRALRMTITREDCAERYFRKQSQRLTETFTKFDQEGAELRDPLPVVECGNRLREIAHQICEYCLQRQSFTQLQTRAVAMLVEIIEKVCERNRDVRRGTRALAYKAIFNLYAYLIGDPPVRDADPIWKKDAFVIERLLTFPRGDLKATVNQLVNIKTYVEGDASGRTRWGKDYAAWIEKAL